jgi:hypothetical protein
VRGRGIAGTSSPSRPQELLLETALLDDAHAEVAWKALRTAFDIDLVEEGTFALLPLLFRRLQRLDPDSPLMPRLHGVYRHTWLRNQMALRALRDALEVLHGANVQTIVVRDAAMALRAYDEVALRPIEEPEVVIPADCELAATVALEAVGWRRTDTGGQKGTFASARGLRLAPSAGQGSITLRGLLPELILSDGPRSGAALWQTAVDLRVADVLTWAPSAANELLRLSVAGTTGSGVRQIQWIPDAVMILEGGNVDWAELARNARRERLTLSLRDALSYLRRLLGVRVPSALQAELEETPVTARERVAHRLGAYGGTVLGSFPATLAQYLRVTAGERPAGALAGAPRFVKQAWGVQSAAEMPVVAVRAVRERVRARRARTRSHSGSHERRYRHASASSRGS